MVQRMGIYDLITSIVAPSKYWEDAARESAQDDGVDLVEAEFVDKTATPQIKRLGAGPANITQLMDVMMGARQVPRAVSREVIIAAYHTVPVFQAAADLVAERIAEISWFCTRDGKRVDHPVTELLEHPNELHDGYTYRWIQQHYFDLLGEEIAVRGGTEFDPELLPFPPTSCRKIKGGWAIRHNRFTKDIADDYVVAVIKPDLRDPYGRGSGIGLAVGDEVEISKYAARHEKAEFANFSVPPLMVFVPGAGDKTTDLAEQWRNEMVGVDNHGRAMFVNTPADPSARPIIHEMTRKMADMSVRELREFSDKLIRMAWRIPPEILGDVQDANRATSEHARDFFNENVLRPRLRWLQSNLQKQLFPHFGDTEGLELRFDDPRVENRGFMLEVVQEYREAFTINEVRELSGMMAREGGDVYLRQGDAGQLVEVPAGEEIVDTFGSTTDGVDDRKQITSTKEDDNVIWMFDEQEAG